MIHNLIPDTEEVFRIKRLRKEVCDILVGRDERDDNLVVLDTLADKKMTTLDMLHLGVVLGVVYAVAIVAWLSQ